MIYILFILFVIIAVGMFYASFTAKSYLWKTIGFVFGIIFGCLSITALITPTPDIYEEVSSTDTAITYRYNNILHNSPVDTTVSKPIIIKGLITERKTRMQRHGTTYRRKYMVTVQFPNHQPITIDNHNLYESTDDSVYLSENFFPSHYYLVQDNNE